VSFVVFSLHFSHIADNRISMRLSCQRAVKENGGVFAAVSPGFTSRLYFDSERLRHFTKSNRLRALILTVND
jgi:hypothetical protein